MEFDIFTDQIKKRRENDEDVFSYSLEELASILGIGAVKHSSDEEITGAMNEIFKSIGIPVIRLAEDSTDVQSRMDRMLRKSGIVRRRVELSGEWWRSASGSMLGSTLDGDVIALKQGGISGYEYKNKNGETVRINKKTSLNINPDAFCFYRPLPNKTLGLGDLSTFMIKAISKADILFILAISLLIPAAGLLLPFMNQQIFNSIIPSGLKENVLPITMLLSGVAAGTGLFAITRSFIITRIRDKIDLAIQPAVIMRLLSLPVSFFKDFPAGDLASRAMSVSTVCKALTDTFVTTGISALFSLIYIFQMVAYAPTLVLPGMIVVIVSLVLTFIATLLQLKNRRKQVKTSAKLSGLVFALFSGIQKIKLAGAEKRAFAKWAALYSKKAKLDYSPPLLLKINSAITLLLTIGGSVVIYYSAAKNNVSPADFLAFNVAYGMVSGAVLALSSISVTAASMKSSLEMVVPILKEVPQDSFSKRFVNQLSGKIELNNVTFRYETGGPVIIDGLSLKVQSGEYVAIAGKTGCGKSTLLRLILGFEVPETGAVYLDGQDLRSLDQISVRQCMGVALQDGKLFPGEILSNLIIAAPEKTVDDAWEAARMAGIEEDIKAMPMGMHTMISEGGGGISGGQKQRLLIARALISKPKILLFDEATSALDNITQKHLSDRISAMKCTRIVIAHRLSTIINADRIIVLDGGKIAEEGNYQTLMEAKGLFYSMTKRQAI